MSSDYIPTTLRHRLTEQARRRCGYCLSQEAITGFSMEVDHILPKSLGALTVEDNLWLACSLCNNHKGIRVTCRQRPWPPTHDACGVGLALPVLCGPHFSLISG